MHLGGVAQACGEVGDPLQAQPEGLHPRPAVALAPQKAAKFRRSQYSCHFCDDKFVNLVPSAGHPMANALT
jgi:hypothetical protein